MTYEQFGNMLGITKQQVHQYVTQFNAPSLELAMMIFVAAKGRIPLHELLAPDKRKRTRKHEKILIIKEWESDIILTA